MSTGGPFLLQQSQRAGEVMVIGVCIGEPSDDPASTRPATPTVPQASPRSRSLAAVGVSGARMWMSRSNWIARVPGHTSEGAGRFSIV